MNHHCLLLSDFSKCRVLLNNQSLFQPLLSFSTFFLRQSNIFVLHLKKKRVRGSKYSMMHCTAWTLLWISMILDTNTKNYPKPSETPRSSWRMLKQNAVKLAKPGDSSWLPAFSSTAENTSKQKLNHLLIIPALNSFSGKKEKNVKHQKSMLHR